MYSRIPDAAFAIGKAVSMTLLMKLRRNFIAHEERISDLEASPAIFPTGTVITYAGHSAPTGFLECDGTVVSRTTYGDLFAICGTSYNTGGEAGTDFRLPDYRRRTMIGVGSGTSLTARTIGELGGEETHALSTSEIPSHNHSVTDPGHTHTWPDSNGASTGYADDTDTNTSTSHNSTSTATGITVNNQGSGTGHNNMQPSLVLKYLIKT